MIQAIMYFGIGFLFASLIGIAVIPMIHARAVRLTLRRVENSIPQSMAEIQADKDLLRAEFAMQARRLEIDVEQLKDKSAAGTYTRRPSATSVMSPMWSRSFPRIGRGPNLRAPRSSFSRWQSGTIVRRATKTKFCRWCCREPPN
jgi:hypothetical protein